ncbi:MAG: molybdate ABC transporter substrate-binding protein [Intestinibacillus sp.]
MKRFHRLAALGLSVAMLCSLLAGCGQSAAKDDASAAADTATQGSASATQTDAAPVELTVFAAASMTETLSEIAEMYKEVAPNVTLVYNFDSSGTLKTQIQEGADCDVFISAGQKQMDQLDSTADKAVNTEGLDFVEDTTRRNILENKVTLVVPEGNPAGIKSFQDLMTDKLKLLAIGNSDVPVGQYTLDILTYLGTSAEELAAAGKVTYGSNVKEVTTQVTEAAADAGVVYATDAYSAGLTVVDTATKDMCKQVIYPAAALKTAAHPEEAGAFLDYLGTEDAAKVFEKVGFTVIQE